MKKRVLSMLVLTAILFGAGVAFAEDAEGTSTPVKSTKSKGSTMSVETDFVINVLPASLLIDMDTDKFGITGPGDTRAELSNVYLMPNFNAGIGVELENFYVEATVGAGLVVNENFRSFLIDALICVQYSFTDSLKMGPHVGLIYFINPEWLETQDVNFADDWGYIAGLQLSMGDRIQYIVSVDLQFASFDAESKEPGWTVDAEEAEMTGLAVQFGVRGEF